MPMMWGDEPALRSFRERNNLERPDLIGPVFWRVLVGLFALAVSVMLWAA